MYDKVFKDFKLESKVSPELLAKYEGLLPEEMLVVWREYGFGTILDGYLKIIIPQDYVEILNDSYYAADRAIPMMMTAFGDLIVWEANKYVMMVKYKEQDIDCLSSTMKWFWNDLLDKDYTDDFFELSRYEKAVAKWGELGYDECFGYTPLLGLGGSRKVANLQKGNAKVHIQLITQMMGRIE